MTSGPGAMAKLALLVATLALMAPHAFSHNLELVAERKGHVVVATRAHPPQARRHEIGNDSRYLRSDRGSTAYTAASNALITLADSAPTSTSGILDRLPTAQQLSQATDITASSKRRSLSSSSTPVSSDSSSSTSTAAQDEDSFSIFSTPAGQSWSSESTPTDDTSSLADDSSGDGTDIFESGDASMQQLYDTMTWSTTYFNSSDDTSTSITGTTSGAAAQQQQQSDQSTTSGSAVVTQESGQYNGSTATGADNQTSSGSTDNLTNFELAQSNLTTPEAQAMYDSTMAGVESPAGTTDYTNQSQAALAPTAAPAAPQESVTSQGQYDGLPQATNTTAPDYLSNLELDQVDLSSDSGVQASTSGYDPSAGDSAENGAVVGGVAVNDSATDPQPVIESAADIAKEAGDSPAASVNTSSNTLSSASVFSDSLGNSLTLESSAPQQAVNLTAPVAGSKGMMTYQTMTLPVVPVGSEQQQQAESTGEPNSTHSSSSVGLQAGLPGSVDTTQAINPASLKRPIKLGVGSDGSAGLRDTNSYDVTTAGNGGAPLGPGVITGVGVSLAGVFILALGFTIWNRNRRQKLNKSEVGKAKHGILKTCGTIPPRAGQQTMPVVVATAGNAGNKTYSPVGSPLPSPTSVSTVGTQAVTSEPEPTPTSGVNLRLFT